MAMRYAGTERVDHAILESRAPSIAALFRDRVSKSASSEAFQYFEGKQLAHVTWGQVKDRVYAMAAGLMSLGIELEDRVAIASHTRYEWALADLAIMCAGGATTTVYPSTIAEDVAYILADSGSKVVFAEDDGQVEKLRHHRDEIPDVAQVVTFAIGDDEEFEDEWIITLDKLERIGRRALSHDPGMVDERIDQITPAHLALLIYTSGTTGRPKGAEITQDAIVYEGASIASVAMLEQGRPAVPVAAPVAHLRQDPAYPADPDRFPHGNRRADRPHRRPPGHRQANVHGRRAADLREGVRADLDDARPGRRREAQAHGLGAGHRPADDRGARQG